MKTEKAQHTPGPWRLERTAEGEFDGAVLAERGDNNGTFRVCLFKYMGHSETAEANARLISAAPELLEAIKELIHLPGYNAQAFGGAVPMAKILKAIDKAEGRGQ